jgi:hypothetical protein
VAGEGKIQVSQRPALGFACREIISVQMFYVHDHGSDFVFASRPGRSFCNPLIHPRRLLNCRSTQEKLFLTSIDKY